MSACVTDGYNIICIPLDESDEDTYAADIIQDCPSSSPSSMSSTPTSTGSSSGPPTQSSETKNETGAIVGGVVGGLAVLCCTGVLVIAQCARTHRLPAAGASNVQTAQRFNQQASPDNPPSFPTSSTSPFVPPYAPLLVSPAPQNTFRYPTIYPTPDRAYGDRNAAFSPAHTNFASTSLPFSHPMDETKTTPTQPSALQSHMANFSERSPVDGGSQEERVLSPPPAYEEDGFA